MASACGLLLALTSGCIRRSLTIQTDPPGAKVFVNDELKGESPLTYPFVWYGWYRLRIYKDGYEPFNDLRELRAPAHLWIPFDLFVELWPREVRDDRTWSYALTPQAEPVLPVPPVVIPEGHPALDPVEIDEVPPESEPGQPEHEDAPPEPEPGHP